MIRKIMENKNIIMIRNVLIIKMKNGLRQHKLVVIYLWYKSNEYTI